MIQNLLLFVLATILISCGASEAEPQAKTERVKVAQVTSPLYWATWHNRGTPFKWHFGQQNWRKWCGAHPYWWYNQSPPSGGSGGSGGEGGSGGSAGSGGSGGEGGSGGSSECVPTDDVFFCQGLQRHFENECETGVFEVCNYLCLPEECIPSPVCSGSTTWYPNERTWESDDIQVTIRGQSGTYAEIQLCLVNETEVPEDSWMEFIETERLGGNFAIEFTMYPADGQCSNWELISIGNSWTLDGMRMGGRVNLIPRDCRFDRENCEWEYGVDIDPPLTRICD